MLNYSLVLLTLSTIFIGCGSGDCCSGKAAVGEQGAIVEKTAPSAFISSAKQECTEGDSITFDGRSSTDTDGNVDKYEWSLDGEAAATGPRPTFSCTGLGVKNVCLKVTDDDNLTSSLTCQKYTVSEAAKSAPVAVINGAPGICTLGETIHVDGAKSFDEDGEVLRYAWTFDNQQSDLVDPALVCAKEGAQELCLNVYDNDALEDKNCTTIIGQQIPNQAPVAELNVSALSCEEGSSVVLDASSSHDDSAIAQFKWTPETLKDAKNSFDCTSPGAHKVCVSVVDDKGLESTQVCQTITVSKKANIPPVANIVVLPAECTVGENVLGDGTTSTDSDGQVVSYLWSVDTNESASAQPKPIFHCDKEGIKHICLHVRDNDGADSTNEACKDITIKPKPIVTIPPVAIMSVSKNVGDSTSSITADCAQSYDPDTVDGDHNPQNDGKILHAEFTVQKTFKNGFITDPHSGSCPKWIGTPDNLDYMSLTLTVTDDDGETTSVTNIYDWDGENLKLRP